MADLKQCDRCGIIEPAATTTIVKVNIGILGPDEILIELPEFPFTQELCKPCREAVAECLKKK